MTLRFVRVSHQRVDLQDDSKWPSWCMPYGRGSIGQTWTILKSGPGWLLMLVEEEKPVVIRGWYERDSGLAKVWPKTADISILADDASTCTGTEGCGCRMCGRFNTRTRQRSPIRTTESALAQVGRFSSDISWNGTTVGGRACGWVLSVLLGIQM